MAGSSEPGYIAWGYMKGNPADGVKRVRESKGRVRYLTAPEERRLRAALVKRDRDGIAAEQNKT